MVEHLDFSSLALDHDLTADAIHSLWEIQTRIEQAAEPLDAEPAGRALSPLAYDAKTGLYVLFGGDHGDYLTNDTWTFDPKARRWTLRHPTTAPPPRANHALTADGDGRVRLTGGYEYANNTEYHGRPVPRPRRRRVGLRRRRRPRGRARRGRQPVAADARLYRTGPFHPDFFLQGDPPDAAAFQKRLDELPVNEWVSIKPPLLPQAQPRLGVGRPRRRPRPNPPLRRRALRPRRLGRAALSPRHRPWELPFPVEFPLGQTYTNTEYPDGFNFNARPWITGHTYQSYGYDPVLKKMLFTGRTNHTYTYDPDRADWTGPRRQAQGDGLRQLRSTPSRSARRPKGLACWTNAGRRLPLRRREERVGRS